MATMTKHPLTKYREDKGLTLEAFGIKVGASKGTVWKWENGEAVPRPNFMQKIFKVTDHVVAPNDWYSVGAPK